MSRFDLNDAGDFARLTLGNVGGVLQDLALAGRSPGEWDILEGSYNGVLFHVVKSKSPWQGALSQVQDSGGRRKVKYQFPYRDGQTTDDLGRKPNSFSMDILIYGNRYLQGLKKIIAEFDKPTPGTLIHPIRGSMKVVVEDFEIIHASDKRKAAAIRVTFLEHNFTIGDIREGKDTSVKGALARALDFIATLENAILQVQGVAKFAQTVKNRIAGAIEDFNAGYATTLTNINVNLNSRGATDIPAILPVNNGGLRNEDGTLASETELTVLASADEDQPVVAAIAAEDLRKQVNSRRAEVAAIIDDILDQGEDALELHQTILDLKQAAVNLQEALETGVASSQAQVIDFIVPRTMSLREVAFINGIDVNRVGEIDLLNIELGSTNLVERGTSVRVPIS